MSENRTIDEMVDEVYKTLADNFGHSCELYVSMFKGEERIGKLKEDIKRYLEIPFNSNYLTQNKNYQDILLSYAAQQCNPLRPPLTCGVDSDHELLVPRITGSYLFLVCPSCGYLQTVGITGISATHNNYNKETK